MSIIKKINSWVHGTPTRLISSYYFVFIFLFAFLFWLPITQNEGVSLSFLDALFTATSGLSATGLTTVSVAQTFNNLGIVLVTILMLVGGLGVMMFTTAVWLLTGHKISTRQRALIMTDQNQTSLSGMVKLVRSVLISFICVQVFFLLILGNYLYFAGYFDSYWSSMLRGGFLAISAATNGGFEIGGTSMILYRDDFFVQTIVMILIFFGSMGFPVILDLQRFVEAKRQGTRFRFSIYTKITLFTTSILWLLGIIGIYIFEWHYFLADKGPVASFYYAAFQSITTRSVGLSTIDLGQFTDASHFLLAALMFVGSSPNSTGGGIRTTTFAIVILSLFSYAKGRSQVNILGREIAEKTVHKAFMIYIFATVIVASFTLFLSATDPFTIMEVLFEVCSAFGTTGLSLGITPYLSAPGKIAIIILMFIGRIGIATFLLLFRQKCSPAKVRYPKTDLMIG